MPLESALRTVNDAIDPTVRNPQNMYQRVIAGLPVINKSVAPKLDVLGRPTEKQGTKGFAALVPGGLATAKPQSSIDAELDRLEKLGMKNIGFAGKHLVVDNYKITLTPEERDRYQKVRGAYLRSYLSQTFSSPEYKAMTDQEKVEAAEDAVRQAYRDAHDTAGDQILAERLKKVRTAKIPLRPAAPAAVTTP